MQRINRALRSKGRLLKKCSPASHWLNELGEFYVIDLNRNEVVDTRVDLHRLGVELGVLKPWENGHVSANVR